MKKILFILHLPPPIHGSSIVGKNIIRSTIIKKKYNTKYINLSTSREVKSIGLISLKKIYRFFSIFFSVLKNLIFWKPDLFYIAISVTGKALYKDSLIVILAKIFNVKILYHLHNKGVRKNKKAINHYLYKFIFRNTNIILISKLLYNDISQFVSKKQVFYCANGIEKKQKITLNKKNKIPKILFFSNIYKSKGVYVLLEACQILKNKGIKFICEIVGNWGDISEYNFNKKLQKMNLTKNVHHKFANNSIEKEKYMIESDIFVHPTLEDCFPLVLLEAMQNNLPVISTIEGGIPDIIENNINGFLVPKNNSKILASKVELLIKNKNLCHSMSLKARSKYENKYTLHKFENELLMLFKKII